MAEPATDGAVMALLKTAHAVARAVDALVAREGISGPQYGVLRILRGARGPLPTMTIAERMLEPAPGITRLLDRLEERGLVVRTRCGEDRRRVLCAATPAGLALLDRLEPDRLAFERTAVARLSEAERLLLGRLLAEVRAALPTVGACSASACD